jgi:type I restriction enzyme R subunit
MIARTSFFFMTPNPAIENERRTRRARINPRLQTCGWQIVSFDHRKPLTEYGRHAIEEYPTANGPADYRLVVDGHS